MEIKTRDADGIVVVDLSGKLDTQTSGPASEELTRIAQGDRMRILVNLENVEFVSSAGLRVLLRLAKTLGATDGVLKICCASGVVKEVMEISGFGTLLDIHETEASALESF